MKYKAIIFDFFGVLCSEVSPFWFQENFPDDSVKLKKHFIEPADRGEVSQTDLFIQLSKLSKMPSEVIENDWIKKAHINTELLAFIETLKSTYKLGILSNSISPYFHTITEETGIKEIFDEIVISSEIKHAKPEPEAYHEILRRLKVKPEESLFVDDNPLNVKAGENLGMDGHIFTTIQNLKNFIQND